MSVFGFTTMIFLHVLGALRDESTLNAVPPAR